MKKNDEKYNFSDIKESQRMCAKTWFLAKKPVSTEKTIYSRWMRYNNPAFKGYRGNKITLKATAVETPDKDTGRTGVHDWATELEAYAQARTAFEKYKVTDIDFQVDDDEDQPDNSVREHVLAQEFWEAEDEEDLWNVISNAVGWSCVGGECEVV